MELPQISPERLKGLYGAVQYILETFQIEYNEDNAEHLLVFMEALGLYNQRTQEYGDLWKQAGATTAFYDAMRKARRLSKVWSVAYEQAEADKMLTPRVDKLDDALDCINYLLFGIRNARAFRLVERDVDERGESFFST